MFSSLIFCCCSKLFLEEILKDVDSGSCIVFSSHRNNLRPWEVESFVERFVFDSAEHLEEPAFWGCLSPFPQPEVLSVTQVR